ncbi:hypothetical protein F5I97DRAFT_1868656 [Phlebopus sp. FC_14]|nr:hypothetical protein F5I97DRAFT_1868656 [Phlebopus sp. FC_14]
MYPSSVQSSLPVETLELIFEHLAYNDLATVVRGNSVFHKIATRLLYRSITGLALQPKRSLILVSTLARNDLYAFFVRHIDLDWSENILTGNFLRLLHRALKRLKSLTQLNLEFSPIDNGTNFTWVLEECTFQLKSLTTSLRCDAVLARFLERQTNLTELCLRGYSPLTAFSLSEHALPRLTHLRTVFSCPRTTADFIRGRPVEIVSMSLYPRDAASSLDALLLSSRTVKRLTVMSFEIAQPDTLLNEVAIRLPNLEALHAVILMTHFTHVSPRSRVTLRRDWKGGGK